MSNLPAAGLICLHDLRIANLHLPQLALSPVDNFRRSPITSEERYHQSAHRKTGKRKKEETIKSGICDALLQLLQ